MFCHGEFQLTTDCNPNAGPVLLTCRWFGVVGVGPDGGEALGPVAGGVANLAS
jgi:hypothetical protein